MIAAEQGGPDLTGVDRLLIDQRLGKFLGGADLSLEADDIIDAIEQVL